MVTWAGEMSSYLKSLDPYHMVSVGGRAGSNGGGEHWTYKANDGLDDAALTALPGVDFGNLPHVPQGPGADAKWADGLITHHQ